MTLSKNPRKGGATKMEKPPEHWKCNGEVHQSFVMVRAELGTLRLLLIDSALNARESENEHLRRLLQLALDDMGDYAPTPKLSNYPTLHSRLPPDVHARMEALCKTPGRDLLIGDVLRGLVIRGLAILPTIPDPHAAALAKHKEALKAKYGDWTKATSSPTFLGGADAIDDFLKSLGESQD